MSAARASARGGRDQSAEVATTHRLAARRTADERSTARDERSGRLPRPDAGAAWPRRPRQAAVRAATRPTIARTPAAPSTARAGRAGIDARPSGAAEEEVDADRPHRRDQPDDDARDRPARGQPRPPDARARAAGRTWRRRPRTPTVTSTPTSMFTAGSAPARRSRPRRRAAARRSLRRPGRASGRARRRWTARAAGPSDVGEERRERAGRQHGGERHADRPAVDPAGQRDHGRVGVAGQVQLRQQHGAQQRRRRPGTGRTRRAAPTVMAAVRRAARPSGLVWKRTMMCGSPIVPSTVATSTDSVASTGWPAPPASSSGRDQPAPPGGERPLDLGHVGAGRERPGRARVDRVPARLEPRGAPSTTTVVGSLTVEPRCRAGTAPAWRAVNRVNSTGCSAAARRWARPTSPARSRAPTNSTSLSTNWNACT